jgi:hypothetical protein
MYVPGMNLRRLTNCMERQKDGSSMTRPRKEAGKRTRKILHTEKLTKSTMYLKMMTNRMQCDCAVVTAVRINVSLVHC